MLQTRVIPCLLLKEAGLVKTIKFQNPTYVGDPVNAVKIFNEKEVDELILLDITATKEERGPQFNLISQIASECFMPLGYGGGIQRTDDMRELYRIGIEKIVINSHATQHPDFIREAADLFGSQSVVVSIDAKKNLLGKYEIYSHAGGTNTKRDPVLFAKEMEEMGAGEIFLNSIDRDGTQHGYDIELIKRVSEALTIPVVACGGAGSVEDFQKAIKEGGASAVAAGSLFVFQGPHRAVLINFPTQEELSKVLN